MTFMLKAALFSAALAAPSFIASPAAFSLSGSSTLLSLIDRPLRKLPYCDVSRNGGKLSKQVGKSIRARLKDTIV